MGLGIEEFVADGMIQTGDRTIREIEKMKLRRTRIQQSTYPLALEGDFHILPLFNVMKPWKAERWKPIPDSETCFSTGSGNLDRMLSGGCERDHKLYLRLTRRFL
ncbi:TPA: hypothetical protein EYP70_03555 [Candidatus Bathyarchaeota archaeon]|nr:hypothetical protein [Candidatus Bathyarchaeota archaeon]